MAVWPPLLCKMRMPDAILSKINVNFELKSLSTVRDLRKLYIFASGAEYG